MPVLAFDPYYDPLDAGRQGVELYTQRAQLTEMLGRCDFVFVAPGRLDLGLGVARQNEHGIRPGRITQGTYLQRTELRPAAGRRVGPGLRVTAAASSGGRLQPRIAAGRPDGAGGNPR